MRNHPVIGDGNRREHNNAAQNIARELNNLIEHAENNNNVRIRFSINNNNRADNNMGPRNLFQRQPGNPGGNIGRMNDRPNIVFAG